MLSTDASAIESTGVVDPAGTIVTVAVAPPMNVAVVDVNATVNVTGCVSDASAFTFTTTGVGFGPLVLAGQVTVPDAVE